MSEPRQGWVAAELLEEYPELRVRLLDVAVRPRRSPPEVRQRLKDLADDVRGSQAVMLRRQAVPHAYRVFFRHIGMDPDRARPPHEALVLERLMHGGFRSHGIVTDALTIATMETGVGLWAADSGRLRGDVGIAPEQPGGRLVVTDGAGVVAPLFGEVDPERAVTKETQAVTLFAVQVPSVPAIHVEEALWLAQEILAP